MSKKDKKPQGKPGQDFLFKIKLKNDLPLIPFDPKLLQYPHAVDRHYKYFDYSLLKDHQYELIHPDGDWGIGCNPFEMGYLEQQLKGAEKLVPRKELLDEKDQELLIDPVAKKDTAVGSVPWLRRTEYISTERNVYGRNLKAGVESKIGLSVMKEEKLQQLLDLSVDGQIQHINQSFEAANKANLATLKHPKKKDLEALEIFPIFPDFEYWSNPFFMTSFDSDPISDKMQYSSKEDHGIAQEESLLKPLSVPGFDGEDTSWVAYYAPSLTTMEKVKIKRKAEALGQAVEFEDEVMEHVFQRDLDYKLDKSAYPYFLELRKDEGGAFYNPIQHHMKLKKKRVLTKDDLYYEEPIEKPTRVLLKERPLSEEELVAKKQKLKELLQREVEDDE